jgi:hypothetical protein
MQNKSEHKLIDGIFEPDEAKTMLNSLINNKINFHNLEDFSNSIRFDINAIHSKKRVIELNEMKTVINELINQAQNDKLNLDIKCMIHISLK